MSRRLHAASAFMSCFPGCYSSDFLLHNFSFEHLVPLQHTKASGRYCNPPLGREPYPPPRCLERCSSAIARDAILGRLTLCQWTDSATPACIVSTSTPQGPVGSHWQMYRLQKLQCGHRDVVEGCLPNQPRLQFLASPCQCGVHPWPTVPYSIELESPV